MEEKLEMFDHTQVAMKKLSAQVKIQNPPKAKLSYELVSQNETNPKASS